MDASFPQQASMPAISTPPAYNDRHTGLVVFGIIQIILGLFALLGIPLILFGAVMSLKTTGSAMPFGSYFLMVASYLAASIILITLGIGSIQARRWARSLTLIKAWVWLIVGVIMTVMITVIMPLGFMASMKAAGGMNPDMPPMSRGFIAVILTIVIVFIAIFMVALPAAFVIFYRRKDVEETCKRRDPVERWTDRCPLPVLAVSVVFGFGVVYYFFMSFTTPFMPFFGRFLTGLPGAVACLCLAALDAYLVIAIYHLKPVGWWVAFATLMLRCVSAVITFSHASIFDAYSKMGMSQKQLEMMSTNPMVRPGLMIWSTLVFMVIYLGYLIWIKRYFNQPSLAALTAAGPLSPSQPM